MDQRILVSVSMELGWLAAERRAESGSRRLSLSLVLRSWQPVLDRLPSVALSHCIARAPYLTWYLLAMEMRRRRAELRGPGRPPMCLAGSNQSQLDLICLENVTP